MSAPSRNHSRRFRSAYLVPLFAAGFVAVANVALPFLGKTSTRRLDRGLRTLGRRNAGQLDGFAKLARLDDLRLLGERRHETRRLERQKIDVRHRQLGQVRQTHFGGVAAALGNEAALGQPTLQRHLAALEADLVKAARARLLTLVAATGSLAEPRADAATDAATRLVRARSGLDRVELHISPLRPSPGN